jgi:hypothetical protein
VFGCQGGNGGSTTGLITSNLILTGYSLNTVTDEYYLNFTNEYLDFNAILSLKGADISESFLQSSLSSINILTVTYNEKFEVKIINTNTAIPVKNYFSSVYFKGHIFDTTKSFFENVRWFNRSDTLNQSSIFNPKNDLKNSSDFLLAKFPPDESNEKTMSSIVSSLNQIRT